MRRKPFRKTLESAQSTGPGGPANDVLVSTLCDEIAFLRSQLETMQTELAARSTELAQERERFDVLYRQALNRIPQPDVDAGFDGEPSVKVPTMSDRADSSGSEQESPAPWWSPRSYDRYTGRKRVLYGTAVDTLFAVPLVFLIVYGGLALDAVIRSTSGVFTWERLGQAAIVSTILALPLSFILAWWMVRAQRGS